MQRILRPERFDANPDTSESKRKWQHWYKTFSNYVDSIEGINDQNKLKILINHLDSSVFECISEIETFDAAITALRNIYVKPTNEVFARYRLATCKQRPGQSLEEFLQCLRRLSTDCNFSAVTAVQHREGAIRDAFIAGINLPSIRQRLLESDNLALQHVFDKARSLEDAQRNAEVITGNYPSATPVSSSTAALKTTTSKTRECASVEDETNLAATIEKCYFCGNNRHVRRSCPAKDATCYKCQKKGHFAKVCRSNSRSTDGISAVLFGISVEKNKTNFSVKINGTPAQALLDTGSTNSHRSENVAKQLKLDIKPEEKSIALAIKGHTSSSVGKCEAEIELNDCRPCTPSSRANIPQNDISVSSNTQSSAVSSSLGSVLPDTPTVSNSSDDGEIKSRNWNYDDDKILLDYCKESGPTNETFKKLSVSLKRHEENIRDRFNYLLTLLNTDSTDTDGTSYTESENEMAV